MAGKKGARDYVKSLWLKSMRTIGRTATNIANNTKYKVDEMTLQNRRREIANDLADCVYAQWMKGERFNPELDQLLEELQQLDNTLNDMRAEKYSQVKQVSPPEEAKEKPESPPETNEPGENKEAEDGIQPETPSSETEQEEPPVPFTAPDSVRTVIDDCFDQSASAEKIAAKMNTSLNQLSDTLRSFSPESSGNDEEGGTDS